MDKRGVLCGESRGCAPRRPRHGQGVGRGAAGIGCCFVFQSMSGGENRGFSGVFSACFVLLEMSPGSCEALARTDRRTLPPLPPAPSPAIAPEKYSQVEKSWTGRECVGTRTHITRRHTRSPPARTPKRRRGAATAPPASRVPSAHTTTLPHSHTHHASA